MDERKLPKWAQEKLEQQRREIASLQQSVAEARVEEGRSDTAVVQMDVRGPVPHYLRAPFDATRLEIEGVGEGDSAARARRAIMMLGSVQELIEAFFGTGLGKSAVAREALCAAIRVFTVDAEGGTVPNGPTEVALVALASRLHAADVKGARGAFSTLCDRFADDTRRLREAAEAFFGGDFRR